MEIRWVLTNYACATEFLPHVYLKEKLLSDQYILTITSM